MATNGTNGVHDTNGTNGTNGVNGSHGPSAIASIEDFQKQDYDYVICGGGTAGLVLAARLTENPDVKVAVLEAGKYRPEDMLIDTPAMFLQMLGHPDYDWGWRTTAQKGNNGNVHHLPRGKALGGSSAINYMMYVRGSVQDYNDWAELVEDERWNAENMMKYMRKHEGFEGYDESHSDRTNMLHAAEFHGTEGPVKTSWNVTPLMPIEEAFIKATEESLSFPKPKDPWSGDHLGFFSTLGSVVRSGPNKGKRSYAGRGYFGLAKERPNLKVLCEALVNKVNLDGNTAKGVNFTHGGQSYDVNARREVIVAGGAIQSPQILELSGIGDPEILRAAGVECKVENKAVGEYFQDHQITALGHKLKPGVLSADALYQPGALEAVMQQYMQTKDGPLSGISSTQGFLPYKSCVSSEELQKTVQLIRDTIKDARTDFEKRQLEQIIRHLESDKSANIQSVLVAATGNMVDGMKDQTKLFPPADPSKPMGITNAICLQYPVARGSIHIQSSDPSAAPLIDPAYGKHPADIEVLAAAVRTFEKVSEHPSFSELVAERYSPEASVDAKDLDQTRKYVRDVVMGEYHACGSVAMGAALDSRLRVKGVNGLRVCDASIFPNNVSGNICSTVYALAEHGADIIKADQ